MSKRDWGRAKERADRLRAVQADIDADAGVRSPNKKMGITMGQREAIIELCAELGRQTAFPKMAYDARIEIERLTMLRDSKRRRER